MCTLNNKDLTFLNLSNYNYYTDDMLNNTAAFVVQNPLNVKENKAIDVKVEHLQRNSHALPPPI